jgi:ferrous iron transport protein A
MSNEHERNLSRREATLDQLPAGERGVIVRMGGDPVVRRRLLDLGLTPGVELAVLRAEGRALLVAVGDTRLALGRDLARAVLIRRPGRA